MTNRIVLARHGPPDYAKPKFISGRAFKAWVSSYDNASVLANAAPPKALIEYSQSCRALFCSNLPRAQASAHRLLSSAHTFHESAIFREAELPTLRVPFVHLPVDTWLALARIAWVCGYSAECESYKDAAARAAKAAHLLIQSAAKGGDVLLIGHGWLNRMIAKSLQLQGWKRGRASGGFWATAEWHLS